MEKTKYITIGIGATDQNGSYRLEFLKIRLAMNTTNVPTTCPKRMISHWLVTATKLQAAIARIKAST